MSRAVERLQSNYGADGYVAYAARLTGYMKDPSRIRSLTLREYGRSPSIDEIAALIADRQRREEAEQRKIENRVLLGGADKDGEDFKVARIDLPRTRKRRYKRWTGGTTTYAPVEIAPPKPVAKPDFTSAKDLISSVAKAFGMTAEDLTSPRRSKAIVAARTVIARILRERNPEVYSYPRISNLLGKSCHSSAIYWNEMFEVFCRAHPTTYEVYKMVGGKG